MWEWKILWKQTKLSEHGALIPRYMFVVQAVPSDVNNSREWYFDLTICWRNARDANESLLAMSKDQGQTNTYSQSSSRSCVKLKMNSSMIRSIAIDLLTSSNAVSAELLKIKLCR